MKFAIIVVMLALAMGAQSSVIPLAAHAHGLSYTAVSGPALVPVHHAAIDIHAPLWAHGHHAAIDVHGWDHDHHHAAIDVHGWDHGHHHAAIVAAPALAVHAPVLAHEGTYVAKTRGAVHTAPLAGHINSAASINLQPAPGTI